MCERIRDRRTYVTDIWLGVRVVKHKKRLSLSLTQIAWKKHLEPLSFLKNVSTTFSQLKWKCTTGGTLWYLPSADSLQWFVASQPLQSQSQSQMSHVVPMWDVYTIHAYSTFFPREKKMHSRYSMLWHLQSVAFLLPLVASRPSQISHAWSLTSMWWEFSLSGM